jgi:hypothetical protein
MELSEIIKTFENQFIINTRTSKEPCERYTKASKIILEHTNTLILDIESVLLRLIPIKNEHITMNVLVKRSVLYIFEMIKKRRNISNLVFCADFSEEVLEEEKKRSLSNEYVIGSPLDMNGETEDNDFTLGVVVGDSFFDPHNTIRDKKIRAWFLSILCHRILEMIEIEIYKLEISMPISICMAFPIWVSFNGLVGNKVSDEISSSRSNIDRYFKRNGIYFNPSNPDTIIKKTNVAGLYQPLWYKTAETVIDIIKESNNKHKHKHSVEIRSDYDDFILSIIEKSPRYLTNVSPNQTAIEISAFVRDYAIYTVIGTETDKIEEIPINIISAKKDIFEKYLTTQTNISCQNIKETCQIFINAQTSINSFDEAKKLPLVLVYSQNILKYQSRLLNLSILIESFSSHIIVFLNQVYPEWPNIYISYINTLTQTHKLFFSHSIDVMPHEILALFHVYGSILMNINNNKIYKPESTPTKFSASITSNNIFYKYMQGDTNLYLNKWHISIKNKAVLTDNKRNLSSIIHEEMDTSNNSSVFSKTSLIFEVSEYIDFRICSDLQYITDISKNIWTEFKFKGLWTPFFNRTWLAVIEWTIMFEMCCRIGNLYSVISNINDLFSIFAKTEFLKRKSFKTWVVAYHYYLFDKIPNIKTDLGVNEIYESIYISEGYQILVDLCDTFPLCNNMCVSITKTDITLYFIDWEQSNVINYIQYVKSKVFKSDLEDVSKTVNSNIPLKNPYNHVRVLKSDIKITIGNLSFYVNFVLVI